jgi:hypothetical protein
MFPSHIRARPLVTTGLITAALLLVGLGSGTAGKKDIEKLRVILNDPERVPALLKAKGLPLLQGDDKLTKLLKARFNEALAITQKRYQQPGTPLDKWVPATERLLAAGLDLYSGRKEKIAFLKQVLELCTYEEMHAEVNLATGAKGPGAVFFEIDLHTARELKLNVEILLQRAQKPEMEKKALPR